MFGKQCSSCTFLVEILKICQKSQICSLVYLKACLEMCLWPYYIFILIWLMGLCWRIFTTPYKHNSSYRKLSLFMVSGWIIFIWKLVLEFLPYFNYRTTMITCYKIKFRYLHWGMYVWPCVAVLFVLIYEVLWILIYNIFQNACKKIKMSCKVVFDSL